MKGIKQQIEESNYKEFEPGVLSVEMLETFIKEFTGKRIGKITDIRDCVLPDAKENEVYSWKDKIKEGYLYQFGTSPYMIISGQGGAINYGNRLQELGFSNEQIEEDIQITETEGIRTDTVFVPIKHITWYKTKKFKSLEENRIKMNGEEYKVFTVNNDMDRPPLRNFEDLYPKVNIDGTIYRTRGIESFMIQNYEAGRPLSIAVYDN